MPKRNEMRRPGEGIGAGKFVGKRFPKAQGVDYIRICDLEKMFRRGGAKRTKSCYKQHCQKFSELLLDRLIEASTLYMLSAKRKTLLPCDVKEASRFLGSTLYS